MWSGILEYISEMNIHSNLLVSRNALLGRAKHVNISLLSLGSRSELNTSLAVDILVLVWGKIEADLILGAVKNPLKGNDEK
jgi:hypothetical protein